MVPVRILVGHGIQWVFQTGGMNHEPACPQGKSGFPIASFFVWSRESYHNPSASSVFNKLHRARGFVFFWELVSLACGLISGLDPVVPFYPILGEGSPTKIDYRKKSGTLILTSLLEDLVVLGSKTGC